MPSYFCCTCHVMVTLESHRDPHTVECEACKKKKAPVSRQDADQSAAADDDAAFHRRQKRQV